MKHISEPQPPKDILTLPQSNCGDIFNPNLPISFDWAAKGMVTSVKDQGYCNSCTIFALMASIESQYLLLSEGQVAAKDVDFSEQAIIDCIEEDVCERGSQVKTVWKQLSRVGLIDESSSPYYGRVSEFYFYSKYKRDR